MLPVVLAWRFSGTTNWRLGNNKGIGHLIFFDINIRMELSTRIKKQEKTQELSVNWDIHCKGTYSGKNKQCLRGIGSKALN